VVVDLEPFQDPRVAGGLELLGTKPQLPHRVRLTVEHVDHDHGPLWTEGMVGDHTPGAQSGLEESVSRFELVPGHDIRARGRGAGAASTETCCSRTGRSRKIRPNAS
jgi:hypothetical protein